MLRALRRFGGDRKGAIAVMGAVAAVFIAGALAISVDGASLYVEKRRAQGAVDLAAIAAARDIARADAAATATIADNGVDAVEPPLTTLGNYTPDPALAPAARFRPGEHPLNAARVELRSRAPVYFARAFLNADSVEIATRATAVASAAAAFSIGSRLLSLDEGILNAVLGRLLGGNVSLTVMDYEALAGFHVDLFRFADALSTRAQGNIATYEELAAANVSMRHVIDALVEVARDTAGGGTAELALQQVGNGTNAGAIQLPAGRIVDFGRHGAGAIGQGGSAFALRASALAILAAAAQIANGSRQVEVVTGLSLSGVSLSVGILIGERPQSSPWIAVGDEDVRVYTAQTRLSLIAEIGATILLFPITIRLPVRVDLAAAEARLASVSCGADPEQDARVTLAVRPAVVHAWIGDPASGWTDFSGTPSMSAAQLVNAASIVTAQGSAQASISNLQDQQVTFDWSDITALRAKTVRTGDFTSSLVASLIGSLNLSVKAGALTLLTPIATLTKLLLEPLLSKTALLDGVLNDLLAVLGVGLGEADVWVHGVRCDGAVLVH